MTTSHKKIEVGGVPVDVVRKDIKNLHLGVYPPGGRVRVAAPQRLDDEAIRLAIVSRLAWVRRQRMVFEQQDRQSKRELVTGESHYFAGRRYRLDVVEQDQPPTLAVRNNSILELVVRPGTTRAKRDAVLQRWYREHLRAELPTLLGKWQPMVGVTVSEVRIKKMKTRWGSCNVETRRIWVNLELAKKPPECLEYILVHEMVHFLERHHNERFGELMDRLMPSWRLSREVLNRAPLAHEEWRY